MPQESSARRPYPRQPLGRSWQWPLAAHRDDFAQRYLAYVLSPVVICILTYLTVRYLGVSHFPGYYKSHLLYHHRYALETALNFGFWIYAAEEWFTRLPGPAASLQRRTVGTTCLLWAGGFGVAIALQLTVIYERIDLYAPKIMHFFDLYPLRRPSVMLRLGIFGAIWTIALSCRLAFGLWLQHLARRKARAALPGLQPANREAKRADETSAPAGTQQEMPAACKPILIPTGSLVSPVQPETLARITSEGHYCRFILRTDERQKEIFTRIALKDVVPQLPPDDFIQIHRSHIINRHHIARLKKTGRAYHLYLDGAEQPLPISRYRWPAIRHRIDGAQRTDRR